MGNIFWIHPPFFRDIWSRKTSETIFVFVSFWILCLLFSQYCLKSKSPLPFEKSIPGLPRLEPRRKVNATTLYIFELLKLYEKLPTCFQTLTFCRNLSFQKPCICQWMFQWFPTPWISHPWTFGEAAGAADKKQDWTPKHWPYWTPIGLHVCIKNELLGQTMYF